MNKDARGKKSTTVVFVKLGSAIVLAKYALASLAIPIVGIVPTMSATDFAMGLSAILGIWQVREYIDKGGIDGHDRENT